MTKLTFESIKSDVLMSLKAKITIAENAENVKDMLDNGLVSVMGCPGQYGLSELHCINSENCVACWKMAIHNAEED